MKPHRIWDVPTRMFHWLLAASIVASWATAELSDTLMQVHMWLGYWTLGLVIYRILWGVIGSRHARFVSFLKGPGTIFRYARSLVDGSHRESAGHNPMGGWMVAVMLALAGAQAVSGLFSSDDLTAFGAWSGGVSERTSNQMTGFHELNFNLIVAAVGAHLVAIGVYQFGLGKDLIGPMLTGHKSEPRVTAQDAIPGTPWLRAALAALLAGAAVYAVLATAPPPAVDDFYYE